MRFSMKHMAVALGAIALLAAALPAQEKPGPLTPPPKREVKRIPAEPRPEPPPIPAEEIIQRFAAKEHELKRIQEKLDYRLTVRVQEFTEDGSRGGDWEVVSDIVFKPDGTRVGRVTRQPASTLKRTLFTLEDLEELADLPQFVLTTDQLPRYEITYQGKQPLDELTTYVFRVQPRRLERAVRQFDGLVWVDDRDFVIVKTYGQMVTEVSEDTPQMPFKMLETYRENIEGKNWLPTYTRSDETVKSKAGEARIRLTMRYSDYRPSRTSGTPGRTPDSGKPAPAPTRPPL